MYLEGLILEEDFIHMRKEMEDGIGATEKRIKSISSQNAEYNDDEERLSKMKEALYGGLIRRAAVIVRIKYVDQIIVCPDKNIELRTHL